MKALRRRNTSVRAAALAGAALLAWSAGPRTAAVAAERAEAVQGDDRSLLALSADEIAALAPGARRVDGSNPRAWRTLVKAGAILKTQGAFPGADLLLRGDAARIEALAVLEPGAEASAIELRVPGATALEVSGAGHVIVRARGGDIVFVRPGLHQETADGRIAVQGGWQDRGEGRLGLQVGEHDAALALSVGFDVLFLPNATLDRNRDGRVTLDELNLVPPVVEGGAAISATKRDTLAVDVDTDGQADPGDTLSYDVVINNTGTPATGIQLADPLDPNLTLVPGSVNVSPLAGDDTFEAIGNVTLSVSNPLAGLFANDTEFLGDAFTITSPPVGVATPTAGGGSVTVQANGTFTYTTAPGTVATSDSFTYTISDGGGLTGSGTVTFTIAGLVWFVDRDAAPGGTGTQASPFDALADVNGAGGAGDPDSPNHFIYLFDRAAAVDYTGGLELESGQHLVGSGAALVVGSTTVLPAGTPPVVVNTTGNGLTLASGVTVDGLTVNAANNAAIAGSGALATIAVGNVTLATSSGGGGVSLTNQTGTFTFAAGSITGNGTGSALLLNGAAGSVNLSASTINKTAGRLVDVQNKTGGTVTFGGVTGTGAATDAIVLQTNTGGTAVNFASGLSVTTTNGRGLFAVNSGTVTIGGAPSTIAATGGAALDLTTTSFGGTATFASVSSTTSTAHGIRLDTVGGTLNVNGGSIVNPAQQGILIQGSSLNATFSPGAQVSGTGTQRILVGTSTGTLDFGNAVLSGGTDGVSLQNNSGGSRTFGTLSVSGNSGVGFLHGAGGGTTTVTGAATISSAGTGVDIQNSASAVTFNGVTVNKAASAGLGVNLATNTTGPSFGALAITTSNGAGLVINNSAITNGGASTISATTGPAISATSATFNSTFTGVSSTGSTVQGINLASCAGTLSMGGGTITTAAGTAFNVSGGSAAVTYAGSVTVTNGQSGLVTSNVAGGSLVLNSLAVSGTGAGRDAVVIDGTGAAYDVSVTTATLDTAAMRHGVALGDLGAGSDITFSAGTITSTGAGRRVVNFTGPTNGIYSFGAVTLSASGSQGLSFGATQSGTYTFRDLDCGNPDGGVCVSGSGNSAAITMRAVSQSGGTNGILLTNTTGSFTVTGNGGTCTVATPTCTGGNIGGTSGADGATAGSGVRLSTASSVSLTRMRLHDHPNFAISGTTVSGAFVLANSVVDGTNGTNSSGGFNEGSVSFSGLTGTASITNSSISGGFSDNVRVVNTSGTLNRITFDAVAIGANSTTDGNDGILLETQGTAAINATIQNGTFTSARGDLFQFNHTSNVPSDLVFTGNALSNNHPGVATGGGGVSIFGNGAGNLTQSIQNNTFRDSLGGAVLMVKSTGTASHTGTWQNNTVGVAAVANSGSLEGSALKMQNAGQGTFSLALSNSQFRQFNNFGIEMVTGGGATAQPGALNATITGNTVANPGNNPAVSLPRNGIHLNAGTVPGDTYQVCNSIGGAGALANTILGSGSMGGTDFRLRQRQSTTVRLPGYGGAATDTAAVTVFVQGNNGGGAVTGLAQANSPPGGGFVGGAPCP